jgi:hypothetical protein
VKIETPAVPPEAPAAATSAGDKWISLWVMDETLSPAERSFGQTPEGRLLDRYALEAAIHLLSSPARITDHMPELAVRRVRDRVAAEGAAR